MIKRTTQELGPAAIKFPINLEENHPKLSKQDYKRVLALRRQLSKLRRDLANLLGFPS
jgi:hypothetical protein